MNTPARQLAYAEALADLAEQRPSVTYRPGRRLDLDGNQIPPQDNGQLQFHRAPHIIRLLAPGNGWGKTGTISVECDWCGFGDHQYDPELRAMTRPRKMLWLCQKYQQWDIIRTDIERWWPPSVVASWVGQPHFRYLWPDGSALHIVTAETDWVTIQGIQPDRVFIDESIPASLWRELIKRRRGDTRTRYCIAATATQGLDWTYHELYLPWKQFHERAGITDEREMMRRQLHRFDDAALADLPGIWCWPQGSHSDNPTATRATWAFYQQTTSGSPAERHVRLYGGYREFAGSAVFAVENLERMRPQLEKGRTGAVEKEKTDTGEKWKLNQGGVVLGGRVTIYRDPEPGHPYCLGLDCAEGIETGDFDAGVILDQNRQQFATIHGKWGPDAFYQVLKPILDWFKPFIVGERQRGLAVLRRLYDDGRWIYFERDEQKRGRPVTDRLGHAAIRLDPPVTFLRGLIGPHDAAGILLPARVMIRDEELHAQCCKFGYRPRSSTASMAETHDEQLVWGAPVGEHDDLVRALALAAWGMEEMPRYEKPKEPVYESDSLGAILKFDELFNPPPQQRRSRLSMRE